MNWDAIRSEFPALENWTWLNTATYGTGSDTGSIRGGSALRETR